MRIAVLAVVAAVSLGAGQARAASLPARQAGLWQSSTYVTLPDGTRARGGAAIVTISCVDGLNDQKFFLINGSACSSLAVTGDGGKYSIDGTCIRTGKPVTVHETLTYVDDTTVDLAGTVDTGTGPITLAAELKYNGPCLPGMAPGDEGSLEADGTFDKTDNINDPGNQ